MEDLKINHKSLVNLGMGYIYKRIEEHRKRELEIE
jgi:hypothetical protein